MISVEEAVAILRSVSGPLPSESCPLAQTPGRVLAQDIVADVDWPPFDTSAMDGYAVRLSDCSDLTRPVAERTPIVAAGDHPPASLALGEAVRVMTGAPLPEGTQAIVPVERARREAGRVFFEAPPASGAHIRRRGESVRAGTVLIRAGHRMTPADIALAALSGAEPARVFKRPRVTIAVTGNELVEVSQRPAAGQLRDSNGPMLASLCAARGWPATLAERVRDTSAETERLFASAGEHEEVLVTSGGVSAGDFDLLPGVASACGFEILFHGVSVRPGKPIAVGRRKGTLWFGLPGNPVSSAVAFHLFARLALDCLEGDAEAGLPSLSARLLRDLLPPGPRETYRDALLTEAGGQLHAEPLATQGSHDIATHAKANALIRLPGGSRALAAGEIVECLVIGCIGPRELESRDSTR